MISHELRTPMTPMKAQLQRLLEQYLGKLTHKQKEALDMVLRNTNRLDNIIVDFLELSRIETGKMPFLFVKTDLKPVLRKYIREMQSFLPEKHMKLKLHIEKIPPCIIDIDRLSQVLNNLLTNAIKFSPDNSTVILSVQKNKGMLLFSITDSGVGIKKENLANVFQPFYQEEPLLSRKHGGTGLGLSICKGIVETQGGKIWIESIKHKGTTVFFTLPVKPSKKK